MTALQAHPALRLPVARLAPVVAGAATLAAALGVAAIALIRPAEVATAVVAGCSVVLSVGAMYVVLGTVRARYLVSLTTMFMGLTMGRLMLSVAIGLAYMLTAQSSTGLGPDKVVFGVVFLGVSLAAIMVETPLVRATVAKMGESIARDASDHPHAETSATQANPTTSPGTGDRARSDTGAMGGRC